MLCLACAIQPVPLVLEKALAAAPGPLWGAISPPCPSRATLQPLTLLLAAVTLLGTPEPGRSRDLGSLGASGETAGGLRELPERRGAAELPGHRGDGGGLREGRAARARVPTRAALMRIRINSAKRGDPRAGGRQLPAGQGRKTPD